MAKSNKKSVLIWVGIIAVVIVGYFVVRHFFFPTTFRYAGTLDGTKVELSSRLQTNIKDIMVHEGDRVKAGQVVVKLTCEDFLADAKIAKINYDRNQQMFKNGTVTKEILDQMANKKESADIKVDWCTIKSP